MGTIEDLARQKIELHAGLGLTLYSEDLETDGNVEFSDEEKLWVATVDWDVVHSAGVADAVAAILGG